jgi:hypothetical protein
MDEMSGQTMMRSSGRRLINDRHLLSPVNDPQLAQMPYLLDHELLRKRSRSPEAKDGNAGDKDKTGESLKGREQCPNFGHPDNSRKQQRRPQIHKRCEHNTRKSECKLCGGSQICMHKRIKSRCKECGGSQICDHNKIRTRCKECKSNVHNMTFDDLDLKLIHI